MAALGAVCAVLTVLLASRNAHSTTDDSKYCTCNEELINRRGFPDGFIFGSGSAAYQIEGAYNESGKGPSINDYFTHTYPEKIADHSNGDVAVDSYHLYKEDVKLLKDMGVDAYNSQCHGLGYCQVEQKDFEDFADVLFRQFGDRVKYWITINEPWALSYLGYTVGVFAPGRCSNWMSKGCTGGDSTIEPYKVTHNQLLAHAAAVKLYRNKYQEVQKGKIGITVNTFWFVPWDETPEGLSARDRAFDFMLGWIMDPITFGRYPKSMRTRVGNRLPEFTGEEAEMVKESFDFVGLNYYSAKYALPTDQTADNLSYITDAGAFFTGVKNGIPIGKQGTPHSYYYIYPKGLQKSLQYIKQKYNDPLIYVTENGLDEDRNDSIPMSEALKDHKRKNNFVDHLCCLREAIKEDGSNVKGYFAWALTDNFQWTSGYLVRFGLHYVDFRDISLRRYPKLSAQYFKSILASQEPQLIRDQ